MDNPEAQQHWTQNKTNEYKKKRKNPQNPNPKKKTKNKQINNTKQNK